MYLSKCLIRRRLYFSVIFSLSKVYARASHPPRGVIPFLRGKEKGNKNKEKMMASSLFQYLSPSPRTLVSI